MNDLELLRQYEPIVRFNAAELFYPTGVEAFVQHCSLWLTPDKGQDQLLVPVGELTIERLSEFDAAPPGTTYYLQFVQEPMAGLQYQQWRNRPERVRFSSAGRLARVPLISRIGDSFFDLSLTMRGVVPGGTTATAEVQYRQIQAADPRYVYHGRVLRRDGWIVLHYAFFYPMNDWRSSYHGVNSHEADWEQIFVYLDDNINGLPQPQWVAMASHDFKGDDLRRRWDDPYLQREDDHPVVYAGAGSHASYFKKGEYEMGASPRFLQPVNAFFELLRDNYYRTFSDNSTDYEASDEVLEFPFIDYARGDGLSIGPGMDAEWSPIMIDDTTPWVDKYRGLWGLDTHDPFGGERAPGGPKYERDGSIRQSWYDPLGWAGLNKVIPPSRAMEEVAARIADLEAQAADLEIQLEKEITDLREMQLDLDAIRATDQVTYLQEQKLEEVSTLGTAIIELEQERVLIGETLEALQFYANDLAQGDLGPPDAHIHNVHHPVQPLPPHHRVVEVWAALSGALALMAFAGLLILRPPNWIFFLSGVVVAFGAIEASTRGRLAGYLLNLTILLAVIAVAILLYEFWQIALLGAVMAMVIFMIRDNLREVLGH